MPSHPPLDLSLDVADLTASLIDINSVSGREGALADAVEESLRRCSHLEVLRDGDAVVARTMRSAGSRASADRVVLAGHLDTVPLPSTPGARGTVPSSRHDGLLYGRGATDMKGGVAVQLSLAASLTAPTRDVTYVFYDHEEVEASLSGLGRLARSHRDWLDGSFAVLLEPTNGLVEGGCNGTLRVNAVIQGRAAHSARAWMGKNAIHDTADLLTRLRDHQPATVTVDGLDFREGLNAVRISGGVAGNVIPDRTVVEINYRFAPDKTVEQAEAYVRRVLQGFDLVLTDAAPGARPGLDRPAAVGFLAAVGGEPKPKYGWTDVARFSSLGIPAVNFGPGDALLAHTDDEHVDPDNIRSVRAALYAWLTA